MRSKLYTVLLTLLAIGLPGISAAKVTYLKDTELPESIQTKIPAELAKYCPNIQIKDLPVDEVRTDVDVVKVDNGKTDYFYHTTFNVIDKEADSNYPRLKTIFVYSAQYALDNGDNTEIQSVFGLEFLNCQ